MYAIIPSIIDFGRQKKDTDYIWCMCVEGINMFKITSSILVKSSGHSDPRDICDKCDKTVDRCTCRKWPEDRDDPQAPDEPELE